MGRLPGPWDRRGGAGRAAPPDGVPPPALRLPAAAGLAVFVVAVGTTQVALHVANRGADRQLRALGEVYLDGLGASVRPGLEARDAAYVAERFARAFAEQRGVAERALFAFTPEGALLARRGDPAVPDARGDETWSVEPAAAGGTAWVGRTVEGAAGPAGRVVAALDLAPVLAARRGIAWAVVTVDLLLAGAFALLTWLWLRRLGRPLHALVRELSAAAARRVAPGRLPDALAASADPRTAAVLEAYNRMADGLRERERLAAELAERERAAALGRLAATVAHEVRNPLAGLATAVSTLRRFGADPAVREESLALLARGVAALERTVSATLDLYRAEEDRRLARADLEDLAVLARPAAARRGVALRLHLDLPEGDLAPGSAGVRQVLLNLLLNACEATPPGGEVALRARLENGHLVCEVDDGGPGLGPAGAARLSGAVAADPEDARSRRLGLGVVVGLLGELDARASVSERPGGGGGTRVRLAVPSGARAR